MTIDTKLPEGLEAWLQGFLDLLPNGTALAALDADMRAGSLLKAVAFLADLRYKVTDKKVEAESIAIAKYKALQDTITFPEKAGVREKQAIIEAHPEYIEINKTVQVLENQLKYISTYIDIFNNGHLHVRQIASRYS